MLLSQVFGKRQCREGRKVRGLVVSVRVAGTFISRLPTVKNWQVRSTKNDYASSTPKVNLSIAGMGGAKTYPRFSDHSLREMTLTHDV